MNTTTLKKITDYNLLLPQHYLGFLQYETCLFLEFLGVFLDLNRRKKGAVDTCLDSHEAP